MMRRAILALAFVGLTGQVAPAAAEVIDSGPGGFTVSHTVIVQTDEARAYGAFVALPRWWDPAHTYSGDARNLRFSPRVGGLLARAVSRHGGAGLNTCGSCISRRTGPRSVW